MEDNQSLLLVLGRSVPRDLYIIIYIVTSYGQTVELQVLKGQFGGKVLFEGYKVFGKT